MCLRRSLTLMKLTSSLIYFIERWRYRVTVFPRQLITAVQTNVRLVYRNRNSALEYYFIACGLLCPAVACRFWISCSILFVRVQSYLAVRGAGLLYFNVFINFFAYLLYAVLCLHILYAFFFHVKLYKSSAAFCALLIITLVYLEFYLSYMSKINIDDDDYEFDIQVRFKTQL